MKKRISTLASCVVALLSLVTLTASVSFGYVTFQGWQHPRVMAKFWSLPDPPAAPPPPGDLPGGDGPEGEGLTEGYWPWDHEALKFARGFDAMFVASDY